MIIEHPEKPLNRKLTPLQADLLRQIVATNGGGISVGLANTSVVTALVRRHLIQGKAGNPARAVHTKLGLEWVRNNPAGKADA